MPIIYIPTMTSQRYNSPPLFWQSSKPPAPPYTAVGTTGCSNSGLDILELGYPTWYLDPTRVIEPVFVHSLFQQLPKKWVIEVNHRHQISMRVVLFLSHVHRQVPLRYTPFNRVDLLPHSHVIGLWLWFGKTESFSSGLQSPTQVTELRHGFDARAWSGYGSVYSLVDSPFEHLHELVSHLETSSFLHDLFKQKKKKKKGFV